MNFQPELVKVGEAVLLTGEADILSLIIAGAVNTREQIIPNEQLPIVGTTGEIRIFVVGDKQDQAECLLGQAGCVFGITKHEPINVHNISPSKHFISSETIECLAETAKPGDFVAVLHIAMLGSDDQQSVYEMVRLADETGATIVSYSEVDPEEEPTGIRIIRMDRNTLTEGGKLVHDLSIKTKSAVH